MIAHMFTSLVHRPKSIEPRSLFKIQPDAAHQNQSIDPLGMMNGQCQRHGPFTVLPMTLTLSIFRALSKATICLSLSWRE